MAVAEAIALSAIRTYNFNVFFQFIQPCSPVLPKAVPAGDNWRHEVKFDGFRVQIHKLGDQIELYSRNGSRFSRRFPRLVSVLREIPARSAKQLIRSRVGCSQHEPVRTGQYPQHQHPLDEQLTGKFLTAGIVLFVALP
jgi:ATP dependent DNA ligase domain